MLTNLLSTLAVCAASALVGYLSVVIGSRRVKRSEDQHSRLQVVEASDESPQAEMDAELLLYSLFQLTSEVNVQVDQHSHRVSEITNSMGDPGNIGSSMILAAGKLLVDANQRLQADLEEAKLEIQQQREMMAACVSESRTDPLTCMANRRAFDLELMRVFAQRRRNQGTFSLLMIDIDHFKRVNDRYGHMVGDHLLKSFSRCLTTSVRETDFVARFGGEEFIAILPKTNLEEACQAAERIREVIAGTSHRVGDFELQVTVSMGVKEVQDDENDVELLKNTDAALYAAKKNGRNCCFYHDGRNLERYVVVNPDTESDLIAESAHVNQPDAADPIAAAIAKAFAEPISVPGPALSEVASNFEDDHQPMSLVSSC